MKVRDLTAVIDTTSPIWVNCGEYFADRYENYAEMRSKTNILDEDEIKYITVDGCGEITIEI